MFEEFLNELLNKKISELDFESLEYKQLNKKRIMLANELKGIINSLSKKDAHIIDSYISTSILLFDVECKYLYLQGIGDGIRLLRFLKLM